MLFTILYVIDIDVIGNILIIRSTTQDIRIKESPKLGLGSISRRHFTFAAPSNGYFIGKLRKV